MNMISGLCQTDCEDICYKRDVAVYISKAIFPENVLCVIHAVYRECKIAYVISDWGQKRIEIYNYSAKLRGTCGFH